MLYFVFSYLQIGSRRKRMMQTLPMQVRQKCCQVRKQAKSHEWKCLSSTYSVRPLSSAVAVAVWGSIAHVFTCVWIKLSRINMNHPLGTALPSERKTKCQITVALHEGRAADSCAWNSHLYNLWHHIKTICRDGTCLHNLHHLVNNPDSFRVWCILICPCQRRSSGSTPPLGTLVLQ